MRSLEVKVAFVDKCELWTSFDFNGKPHEKDKEAFLWHFHPYYTWGQRWHPDPYELRELLRFIELHRIHYHGNPPRSNAQLEETLKWAVRCNRVIVVLTRRESYNDHYPSERVKKIVAPDGLLPRQPVMTRSPRISVRHGEPILPGPYDPSTRESLLAAARRKMQSEKDLGEAAARGKGSVNSEMSSLNSSQPFEYVRHLPKDGMQEIAASTKNPNHAAKMLGYNRDIFGNMLHSMKDYYRLRGDDNVLWHDNGDVEFNGEIIDNMHSWGP